MLRKGGEEEAATLVLIGMNDDRAAQSQRWASLILAFILKWTIGYGYRPWRPFWYVVVIVGLGYGLFAKGETVFVRTDGREPTKGFSPFFYSLDVFVPGVDLSQQTRFTPDPERCAPVFFLGHHLFRVQGWVVAGFVRFETIAGWILAALSPYPRLQL